MTLEELSTIIVRAGEGKQRLIVAIVGPPASGKTTLAHQLCEKINTTLKNDTGSAGASNSDGPCVTVPMDGFHLDNDRLDELGLRHVKGAPQTFDADGFVEMISAMRTGREAVCVPGFDRSLDAVVAGELTVNPHHRIVLAEGNYLLLDKPPWDRLKPMFDFSVMLDPGIEVLEQRLIERWENHDHSPEAARARAHANDIPNAKLVVAHSFAADLLLDQLED